MRIIACEDIFALPRKPSDAVCVTTNGIVKTNGHAVMGKGIALEADQRFQLGADLGTYLKQYGNRAFYMGVRQDAITKRRMAIITFPTKHHWRDPSDIHLIRTSCVQAIAIADKFALTAIYLPIQAAPTATWIGRHRCSLLSRRCWTTGSSSPINAFATIHRRQKNWR